MCCGPLDLALSQASAQDDLMRASKQILRTISSVASGTLLNPGVQRSMNLELIRCRPLHIVDDVRLSWSSDLSEERAAQGSKSELFDRRTEAEDYR